jgi:hypothetical protein
MSVKWIITNNVNSDLVMTEQERTELDNHVQAIAAILYKDSKDRDPSKLKTLAGIELEVREQVQKHVSSEIGVFLLAQTQAQHRAEQEQSRAT